jgi:hypothetical protein
VKREALTTPPSKPFAVMLDSPVGAEHAALYAASRGQLRAAGLDPVFATPANPAQPLSSLAEGRVKVSIARPSEVLIARDRGQLLVSVAALAPLSGDAPVLVVREHEAVHDGEDLRAFLHALAQGAKEAQGDPAVTAALLAKANPALLGRASKAARAQRLRQLEHAVASASATTPGKPFGYQEPEAWATLASSMFARHLLRTDPQMLAPPYTNEYLPGEGV